MASSSGRPAAHAETLATLAARYAPHGVVGFGLGCSDAELATLARHSVTASAAPPGIQRTLLAGIDDWLETSS